MLAPTMGLYYRLTVRDVDGRIVSRTRLRKAHSYLKQFIQILRCRMTNVDEASVLDTSNASQTLEGNGAITYVLAISTAAGTSTSGAVIGTGSTAVTISDYALGTQIAHGTGSGQMEYGGGSFGSAIVAGSTASYTVSRAFTNSSGASITVNEIGIYVIHTDSSAASRFFCIVRDVVSGGQAVGNTNTVTVEYVVKATV